MNLVVFPNEICFEKELATFQHLSEPKRYK
jgi:hypothetical protein